jgi:Ca2+-binding EF-hand superfamily protein
VQLQFCTEKKDDERVRSLTMKRLFRSRLPTPLTSVQMRYLADQSRLPSKDIEEWYERFNHCYPRGYLSCQQFTNYLKEFHSYNDNDKRSARNTVKQLFRLLDLNEDKHLNFDEFFLFNILINQGSNDDKLRLILRLYDRERNKYLTQQQLERVLSNMFELLSIPKPIDGLAQTLETISVRTSINDQSTKISWNTFSTFVLNDPSLFELLLSGDIQHEQFNDEFPCIVTRF